MYVGRGVPRKVKRLLQHDRQRRRRRQVADKLVRRGRVHGRTGRAARDALGEALGRPHDGLGGPLAEPLAPLLVGLEVVPLEHRADDGARAEEEEEGGDEVAIPHGVWGGGDRIW